MQDWRTSPLPRAAIPSLSVGPSPSKHQTPTGPNSFWFRNEVYVPRDCAMVAKVVVGIARDRSPPKGHTQAQDWYEQEGAATFLDPLWIRGLGFGKSSLLGPEFHQEAVDVSGAQQLAATEIDPFEEVSRHDDIAARVHGDGIAMIVIENPEALGPQMRARA